METIDKKMRVPLEAEDYKTHAQRAAQIINLRMDLEREKKAFVSAIKGRDLKLEAELAMLTNSITEGEMDITIPCRVIRNFEQGIVRYYRCDNGEMIEERPFTKEELAMPIPMEMGMDDEAGPNADTETAAETSADTFEEDPADNGDSE